MYSRITPRGYSVARIGGITMLATAVVVGIGGVVRAVSRSWSERSPSAYSPPADIAPFHTTSARPVQPPRPQEQNRPVAVTPVSRSQGERSSVPPPGLHQPVWPMYPPTARSPVPQPVASSRTETIVVPIFIPPRSDTPPSERVKMDRDTPRHAPEQRDNESHSRTSTARSSSSIQSTSAHSTAGRSPATQSSSPRSAPRNADEAEKRRTEPKPERRDRPSADHGRQPQPPPAKDKSKRANRG
jgi:hypothetical protein